jgi:hypothetical protein
MLILSLFRRKFTAAFLLLLAFPLVLTACATTQSEPQAEVVLPPGKEMITLRGYALLIGEWALYPGPDIDAARALHTKTVFSGNILELTDRCQTMIPYYGIKVRKKYSNLNGKHVEVKGFKLNYEELDKAKDVYNQLLGRRFYKDVPWDGYCLRDDVIIVTSMTEIKE